MIACAFVEAILHQILSCSLSDAALFVDYFLSFGFLLLALNTFDE